MANSRHDLTDDPDHSVLRKYMYPESHTRLAVS